MLATTPGEAVARFNAAIAANDLPKAKQLAGQMLSSANAAFIAGDYELAIDWFRAVYQLEPGLPGALLGLARSHAALNRDRDAMEFFKKYLETEDGRDDWQAHYGLGMVYVRSNLWYLAKSRLEKANELSDQSKAEVLLGLARCYEGLGKKTEAEEMASAAALLAPDNPEAHGMRALMLARNGKFAEAAVASRTAIALGETRLRGIAADDSAGRRGALDELARHLLTLREILRAGLQLNPAEGDLHHELLIATLKRMDVLRQRELLDAVTLAERSAQQVPSHVGLLVELATLYRLIGRSGEAIETCRKVLTIDRNNRQAKQMVAELSGAATRSADGSDTSAGPP